MSLDSAHTELEDFRDKFMDLKKVESQIHKKDFRKLENFLLNCMFAKNYTVRKKIKYKLKIKSITTSLIILRN